MENYKIVDFLKEDMNHFIGKEIIVNMPLLKVRGTILEVKGLRGDRRILIQGFMKGCNFKGENPRPSSPNSQITLQILVDDLIQNYKTDRIRIVII